MNCFQSASFKLSTNRWVLVNIIQRDCGKISCFYTNITGNLPEKQQKC